MTGYTSLQPYHRPHVDSLPGVYEPFSAISHLAGALLFAYLGRRLLRRGGGSSLRRIALAAYVGSCVLLFATSGLYHAIAGDSPARAMMARLDHSAIFILIAGTFTPVHAIAFRSWGRWLPLILIWAAAMVGIALKLVYFNELAEWISLGMYLFLGWLGALSGTALALRRGFAFVRPALWGGIAYSVGAVCEFFRWPVLIPGVIHSHELFHMAVLIGALFHWSFIWRIATAPHDVPEP